MRKAASNSLGRKDSQNLDQVPPKRTGLGPVVKAHPIDGSPPGSSVHRILQARILQWVAIFVSKRV